MRAHILYGISIWLAISWLSGCASVTPETDLTWGTDSLKERQLQTRYFEKTDELKILNACAALLQDIGFTIEESDSQLGLITGVKERDATRIEDWVFSLMLAMVGVSIDPDHEQIMLVTVVTRPVQKYEGRIAVRINFLRAVYDTKSQVKKIEALNDPGIYQAFFEKLSKALFLDAHGI